MFNKCIFNNYEYFINALTIFYILFNISYFIRNIFLKFLFSSKTVRLSKKQATETQINVVNGLDYLCLRRFPSVITVKAISLFFDQDCYFYFR